MFLTLPSSENRCVPNSLPWWLLCHVDGFSVYFFMGRKQTNGLIKLKIYYYIYYLLLSYL